MITNPAKTQTPRSKQHQIRRILKGLGYGLLILLLLISAILIFFRAQASFRETKTRLEVAPSTGRFVPADDVEIFIQELGPPTGPPVLFVHGTGAWSEIWRETMVDLAAAGFRAIALDLPPFGFSERPEDATYDRSKQGKRIVGVLEALNLTQVTLVGHSFGAGPTVEAALLAPERVQTLVLVDAALALGADGQPRPGPSPIVQGIFAVRPLRNGLVATTMTNPHFTKRLLQLLILDPADATDAQITMLQQQLVIEDSTDALGEWLQDFIAVDEGRPEPRYNRL
jgi:pimeloyl-ACP methyl ester carboxylesterase